MADLIFGNILATILVYVPYALLFILAFRQSLRHSLKTTYIILALSTVLRVILIQLARHTSSQAVIVYNYLDLLVMILFGIVTVKSKAGRMLFVGLMLKNTADTIVILAKYAEHLVNHEWAMMGYHWTYSVSLMIFEACLLPVVYVIIQKYFTHEIRESISNRWFALWLIPLFFYCSWGYIFYYHSDETDLQLACQFGNSVYLLLSISCQYMIYVCLATLVESLQHEARLQAENHAIQMQALQYNYMSEQIEADRRMRHDIRHHITAISSLLENGETERLHDYIAEYIKPGIWMSKIHYCSNTVLNLMVSYYASKCNNDKIDFFVDLHIPETLPLSDTDLTVLFGNLLENAYEACLEISEYQSRQISLHGNVINNSLLFSIENTYQNDVRRTPTGDYISTKHDGHGIGIRSCIDIVDEHGGSIDFSADELFVVNLMF